MRRRRPFPPARPRTFASSPDPSSPTGSTRPTCESRSPAQRQPARSGDGDRPRHTVLGWPRGHDDDEHDDDHGERDEDLHEHRDSPTYTSRRSSVWLNPSMAPNFLTTRSRSLDDPKSIRMARTVFSPYEVKVAVA